MPSFISKFQRSFLHRKKDDASNPTFAATSSQRGQSDTNLLAPKKELQSSSASAIGSSLKGSKTENNRIQAPSTPSRKFSFNRTDSSKALKAKKSTEATPHLSLKLPDPNPIEQPVEPFFEGIGKTSIDKKELDRKRLSAQEVLKLLQAGSAVVVERGLETLGIFRPHWHSESPVVQHSLLSLFISSLVPMTKTSGTQTPFEAFQSELRYTSDPHDITSIIKWGLRHMQLESDEFASSSNTTEPGGQWSWYRTFATSERELRYPPTAFSSILLPSLPSVHAELLKRTLDLVSSVAAHADANAMSGSKLSKALGLWVIGPRAVLDHKFTAFYHQWDVSSRIMEHVFLAFVRDMEQRHKLPKRLAELVASYPFSGAASTDDYFLAKPRFTTHQYKAVLVRLTRQRAPSWGGDQRFQPLDLLGEALTAKYGLSFDTSVEVKELWETIKAAVVQPEGDEKEEMPLLLSNVASDESLRIMSMCDPDDSDVLRPPIIVSPIRSKYTSTGISRTGSGRTKRRSFSLDNGRSKPSYNSLTVLYEDGAQPTKMRSNQDLNGSFLTDPGTKDWDSFSSSGFSLINPKGLADTLNTTQASSPLNGLSSSTKVERRRSHRLSGGPKEGSLSLPSTVSELLVVPLDEAFIDVWSDSLLDPTIRKNWPEFALCQLSEAMRAKCLPQGVEWLIIERESVDPPPAAPTISKSTAVQRSPSNVSSATTTRFARSFSRVTSDFRGKRRFSLFSNSDRPSISPRGRKESSATVITQEASVSELGEISSRASVTSPPSHVISHAPDRSPPQKAASLSLAQPTNVQLSRPPEHVEAHDATLQQAKTITPFEGPDSTTTEEDKSHATALVGPET